MDECGFKWTTDSGKHYCGRPKNHALTDARVTIGVFHTCAMGDGEWYREASYGDTVEGKLVNRAK